MTLEISIVNAETGKQIIRDMTDQEVASHEAGTLEAVNGEKQREAEAKTKAAEKAALLSKLGITAEEAALLLG
jgi:hypothetical protein